MVEAMQQGNDAPQPASRPSRRDALLDAFCDLVLREGDRAATLDAVAKAANVSKGGLLYHFPNREALVAGLCDRLRELVDADLAQLAASELSPTEWYLRTSVNFESDLERAHNTLIRLAPAYGDPVRATLVECRERWLAPVEAELEDPDLATAVLLIGDGIAHSAEVDGANAGQSRFSSAETAAKLAKYILGMRMLRR